MKKAILTAIGSLQDFPAPSGTQDSIEVSFELQPSVKDAIEAEGIPHTAIFGVTINGKQQGLDYNLRDGDEIVAYPFEEVNHTKLDPIFSAPEAFICDVHLGKLTKTLRLLGFDTLFDNQWDDEKIIRQSNRQRRMILTRDLELLKNGSTQYGYWVRSTDPDRQIEELFQRFFLSDNIDPFTRCMKCNGFLNKVPLDQVSDRVPPKVKQWHSDYRQCESCGQVYWQGSHYEKLKKKVNQLKKEGSDA